MTILNLPEQPAELTQKLATEATAPHSRSSYVISIVVLYYGVIIESLECCQNPSLEVA